VFGFAPRALQQAIAEALPSLNEPAVLLVEAPMGEGKTEAAFFAHVELQRRFGHRGFYTALPTMATGNAMFTRTLNFLRVQGSNRRLDLQLAHSGALLNEAFQTLKVSGICDEKGGEVRAGEWFTNSVPRERGDEPNISGMDRSEPRPRRSPRVHLSCRKALSTRRIQQTPQEIPRLSCRGPIEACVSGKRADFVCREPRSFGEGED
jgi:hypothetical protein